MWVLSKIISRGICTQEICLITEQTFKLCTQRQRRRGYHSWLRIQVLFLRGKSLNHYVVT